MVPPNANSTEANAPEMIPSNHTLQTCSDARVAVILTQLDRLVDPAITVAEVGRKQRPEMNPETFFGAAENPLSGCRAWKGKTHNPIARA